MNDKLLNFMLNYGSPFFVGSLITKKVIFVNKVAENLFGVTPENCDFSKLFEKSQFRIEALIANIIDKNKPVIIHNITAITANQDRIYVDIRFGFFDENQEEIFLEITPQGDANLQATKHFISQSLKAEAILNTDEEFTIYYCNEKFYELFEVNKDDCIKNYCHKISNAFALSKKEELKSEIHNGLLLYDRYCTDIEIELVNGGTKWIELDFQKRDIDNTNCKIICTARNINDKRNRIEKLSQLNQYLSAMQEISSDILFRIDVNTMTLKSFSDNIDDTPDGNMIYINLLKEENLVHPDDIKNAKDWISGLIDVCTLRFLVNNEKYEWFKIQSKRIFDENGNLKDIFGKLVNIQEQEDLKANLEHANERLSSMQKLSDDILYRIDVASLTLYYTLKSKNGDISTFVIENYNETAIKAGIIHPEDADLNTHFTKEWLKGNISEYSHRLKLGTDDYIWYSDSAYGVFDSDNKLIEIYGRLKNIQQQVELKTDLSIANKYLSVMQDLSDDILCRIDFKTLTLYHSYKGDRLEQFDDGMSDYLNTLVDTKIVHPDDALKYMQGAKLFLEDKLDKFTVRIAMNAVDYKWYDIINKKIYDANGNLYEIYSRMINVEDKIEMQREYSELNQYFSAMQNLSNKILFHIDLKTKTFRHADKFAFGLGVPEELPNFVDYFIKHEIIHPDDINSYQNYVKCLFENDIHDIEIRIMTKNGVFEWFNIKSQFIYGKNGSPTEVFGTMKNVQEHKDLTQKATQDLMTNVLNKVSFEEKIAKILKNSTKTENHALIFIDLDDFKGVNDNLGHRFGDFLLTSVGTRLKNVISDADIVGRIGGDEFAVFLHGINDDISALELSNLLLEALRCEFSFESNTKIVKASLGIAMYPNHGTNYPDLLQKSDIALYFSKKNGKDVATLYDETMEDY